MRPAHLVGVVSLFFIAFPQGASAYDAPFMERVFGATDVIATAGNGRLTLGVSDLGDATVISWPSPSYFDHVHYTTTNAPDARDRRRMGAQPGMGVYAGLVVQVTERPDPVVLFFHDEPWQAHVHYLGDETTGIETTYTHDAYGLIVTQVDVVPPELDVWLRRFTVERTADSPVESARLLSYANLSPGLMKFPEVPLADFALDHKNDFLAAWDASEQAVIHFHPADTGVATTLLAVLEPIERDFGPLGALLAQPEPSEAEVAAIVDELDNTYAPGVVISLTTLPAPARYQVGVDATDTCAAFDDLAENLAAFAEENPGRSLLVDPSIVNMLRCGDYDPVESVFVEEGWQHRPQDARADALDGDLSGSPLAGAQANTALLTDLVFDSDRATALQVMAFGTTRTEATSALATVREQGFEALLDETRQADLAFVERIFVPEALTAEQRAFCLRVFLNIKVGMDRETGAVLAAISRQPSYQLDWPRDGAFFNVALDLAGFSEIVEQRMGFYTDTMRDRPVPPVPLVDAPVPGWPDDPDRTAFPPDSWEMNYYADGMVGGPIRLEIDNTALLVWSYVYHVGHTEGAARDAYMERIWPVVQRGADFLASWRDPETGLVWWANEDDHPEYTQGIQGASTVYGALVAAARLAEGLGHTADAERWLHRAGELRSAVRDHLLDEGNGYLDQPGGGLAGGKAAWVAWPTHLAAYDDETMDAHLRRLVAADLSRVQGEVTEGGALVGSYPTKSAIASALAFPDGDPARDQALAIAEGMVGQIADPHTWTIGEVFVNVDEDDDGQTDRRVNAVSTPHLWSATLVYLTFVAYHHPERFDAYIDALPAVVVPEVPAPSDPDVEPLEEVATEGELEVGEPPLETVDAGGDTIRADDVTPDPPGDPLADTRAASDADDGCGCWQQAAPPTPIARLVLFLAALCLLFVHQRRDR